MSPELFARLRLLIVRFRLRIYRFRLRIYHFRPRIFSLERIHDFAGRAVVSFLTKDVSFPTKDISFPTKDILFPTKDTFWSETPLAIPGVSVERPDLYKNHSSTLIYTN